MTVGSRRVRGPTLASRYAAHVARLRWVAVGLVLWLALSQLPSLGSSGGAGCPDWSAPTPRR